MPYLLPVLYYCIQLIHVFCYVITSNKLVAVPDRSAFAHASLMLSCLTLSGHCNYYVLMRDERRKKEASKGEGRGNETTKDTCIHENTCMQYIGYHIHGNTCAYILA